MMSKRFKYYIAAWAMLLAVFNVICFVIPEGEIGGTKFTSAFWVGYVMITIAFAGQLACAFRAFQAQDGRQLFYRIPLVSISYAGLILTLIGGGVCMVVPGIPYWVGIIVAALILGFTAIAVIKASAAAEIVSETDERIAVQTNRIRSLTAEAETLPARAGTPAAKAACKRVYEALRYADPMSTAALADMEDRIADKLHALSAAVADDAGAEKIPALAAELEQLIAERNAKCKGMKSGGN